MAKDLKTGSSQQAAAYKSLYSGMYITATQYVAETLCYNRALALNMELPAKFWYHPNWCEFYIIQLRAAAKFIKEYEPEFLVKTINTNKIWSLYPSWVKTLIEKEYKNYSPLNNLQKFEAEHAKTFKKQKEVDTSYLD